MRSRKRRSSQQDKLNGSKISRLMQKRKKERERIRMKKMKRCQLAKIQKPCSSKRLEKDNKIERFRNAKSI
jgi:hypothetical protein